METKRDYIAELSGQERQSLNNAIESLMQEVAKENSIHKRFNQDNPGKVSPFQRPSNTFEVIQQALISDAMRTREQNRVLHNIVCPTEPRIHLVAQH